MYSTIQEYISLGMFREAIEKLKDAEEKDPQHYMLLSKIYHAQGRLDDSYGLVEEGVGEFPEEIQLLQRKNEYFSHTKRLEKAVQQIADGKHTTDEINFAKSNITQLVDHKCFEVAIERLRLLANARKSKTTNILWIGNCLKDLYFHPEAEECKDQFDDLLFEEMLFYYLKSCKLFEPEYKLIQQAKKELKDKGQV
ncbi:MAG: tetratricopeptide (TPR) repeat protein [Flammeovirgaceae bacterium]|jgi:tetratricopeptide (TPR) repeat protein